MPSVYNGCGTWYYGKKNLVRYEGVCRHCKRRAQLSTYDTRLWIVVVFVPIIPLRRRHIIEECPVCRRHGVMSWHQWETARQRTAETISAYKNQPANADLAREAIAACATHRNRPAFMELAPQIESSFAADEKTLVLVAMAYDLFGEKRHCERALRAAHLVKPDEPGVREALAECLMDQGKPAEAEPLLRHIVEKGIPDRVDHLYRLAQGYQMIGDHQKALEVFGQCEQVNPSVSQDETFRRLRDASAQRLGSKVPVKPSQVISQAKRSKAWRKTMKVVPIVLALAIIVYCTLCWLEGTRQTVYVVNGLDRAYTLRINGEAVSLSPQSAYTHHVHEGNVHIEPADAGAPVAPLTVLIHTPFLTRPFDHDTLVINPDRAALLRQRRVFYASERSGNATPPVDNFLGGEGVYVVRDVDYPFGDFPRSISMDSSTREVSKENLTLVAANAAQIPLPLMLISLERQIGPARAAVIAQRRLVADPLQSDYLDVLERTMKPAEAVNFLRPYLSRRPVLLQWHRTYQDVMGQLKLDTQCEREYDQMLASEPSDNNLKYLAGRASHSPDKKLALYEQAAGGDFPCTYAFQGLCGYHLANAQFKEAVEDAKRAMAGMPDDWQVAMTCRRAFMAAGRNKEAIELARGKASTKLPASFYALADEAYLDTLVDNQVDLNSTMRLLRVTMEPISGPGGGRQVARVQAEMKYCAGNDAEFTRLLAASTDPDDRFAADIAKGDLDAANRELGRMSDDLPAHLVMYIAASNQGRDELARSALKTAILLLDQRDFETRAVGAALSGKPTQPTADLTRLVDTPQQKLLLLVAVGLHDAGAKADCFALARKLNDDKRFPYLLIKSVLKD